MYWAATFERGSVVKRMGIWDQKANLFQNFFFYIEILVLVSVRTSAGS